MKKLFAFLFICFWASTLFAQVRPVGTATQMNATIDPRNLQEMQVGQEVIANIPKCFCCGDSIYQLPKPPVIIAPAGPVCACDVIKFSTVNCPGATLNWTVKDNKGNSISINGNGTNAISLNYTLAQQVASGATSLTVTLEVRCGNKVVKNTITVELKPIPKTNVSFSLSDDGNGNYTATATGMAPGNGNGWTLKEVNCPGPNPCAWVAGPIKWQSTGNTINIPSSVLVKGKCYVLTHYVNVCSPVWVAGPCTVYKATCFMLNGNAMRSMAARESDKNDAQEITPEMLSEIMKLKQ